MTDPRDALLLKALEALYWWDMEHGCCRGATDDVEESISRHLLAVGESPETYSAWATRQKQEVAEKAAARSRGED